MARLLATLTYWSFLFFVRFLLYKQAVIYKGLDLPLLKQTQWILRIECLVTHASIGLLSVDLLMGDRCTYSQRIVFAITPDVGGGGGKGSGGSRN